MEIPNSIIVAGIIIQNSLIGAIFGMLRYQIKGDKDDLEKQIVTVKDDLEKQIDETEKDTDKCERVLHKRIDKVETGLNLKLSLSAHERSRQLVDVELEHVRDLVAAYTKQNSKEHDALIEALKMIGNKQDATNEAMSEMVTCLALLSENVPCKNGNGKKN